MKPLITIFGLFMIIAIIKPPILHEKHLKKDFLEFKNMQRDIEKQYFYLSSDFYVLPPDTGIFTLSTKNN